LELLVVMLALMVVMSMGFQILLTSGKSAARGLSLTSQGERLRLLQKMMDRDLGSRYAPPSSESLVIGNTSAPPSTQVLLRVEILNQPLDRHVELRELTYTLEETGEGSDVWAVVRTLDPDLEPGRGPESDARTVFQLRAAESLTWEATSENVDGGSSRSWLTISLQDSQFKGFLSQCKVLLAGYAP
jgi:hypothetical protein